MKPEEEEGMRTRFKARLALNQALRCLDEGYLLIAHYAGHTKPLHDIAYQALLMLEDHCRD